MTSIRFARVEDCATILGFIKDLAEYERLSHEVVADEATIRATLFPPQGRGAAEVIIAEVDGAPVGFALFFTSYSTFLAKSGLYLEDLFVRPAARGKGAGLALMAALAQICVERGYGRFEWAVLDWNEPALEFYRRLGAKPQNEWTVQRLVGEPLVALAKRSGGIVGLVAVVVAIGLVLGCQSSSSSPSATPSGSGVASGSAAAKPRDASTPAASPGTGFPSCDLGVRVTDKLKCDKIGAQDLAMTLKAFRAVASAAAQTQAEPGKVDATCMQMLAALDHSVVKQGCTLELTAEEREKLKRDLDAYFAQRTPVTATGNAEVDAVVTRAAALRDKMCACDTMACAAGVDAQLDTIGHLPKDVTPAASTLANRVVDDIGRCESRIKLATDSP